MADELPRERFEELVTNPALFDEVRRHGVPAAVWFEIIRRYPERLQDLTISGPIPIEVMEVLARCDDKAVVWNVACKKLTPELFSLLAKSKADDIRAAITGNRHTPDEILEMLSHDPIDLVRENAQRMLAKRIAKRKVKR